MKQVAALISYDMTSEEEVSIISSLTEEQKAFFLMLRTNCILERSGLKFSHEAPFAHVQYASNLDGKIELLNMLLSDNSANQSQENQNG